MKQKLWLLLFCATLTACASSKSDPNQGSRINLLDPPELISKKIKRAKTDPTMGLEFGNPERPEADNLLGLYALLAGRSREQAAVECGSMGWGSFKPLLADAAVEALRPGALPALAPAAWSGRSRAARWPGPGHCGGRGNPRAGAPGPGIPAPQLSAPAGAGRPLTVPGTQPCPARHCRHRAAGRGATAQFPGAPQGSRPRRGAPAPTGRR